MANCDDEANGFKSTALFTKELTLIFAFEQYSDSSFNLTCVD